MDEGEVVFETLQASKIAPETCPWSILSRIMAEEKENDQHKLNILRVFVNFVVPTNGSQTVDDSGGRTAFVLKTWKSKNRHGCFIVMIWRAEDIIVILEPLNIEEPHEEAISGFLGSQEGVHGEVRNLRAL